MSILEKLACHQNRRDEVPNQELARELVETQNREGLREIAENLWNKDKNVRADCIKVLYEAGYLAPELIAAYTGDFLKLTKSRNNRLVWGGMIALSTVAALKADELFPHVREIEQVMDAGSVITRDCGVRILVQIAAQDEAYRREIFPYLLSHLATCRPKDVAQHSEKSLPAVDGQNQAEFIALLEKRSVDLSKSELARVRKVIKTASKGD
jgi:hypothetical protein